MPTKAKKIISVHNIYPECVPALHSSLLRLLTLDIALACANESRRISTCIAAAAIHAPSTLKPTPPLPILPLPSHLTRQAATSDSGSLSAREDKTNKTILL